MSEMRNYWVSKNTTKVLAAIANGIDYSQAIADKLTMAQPLVHSYIKQLKNQKILIEGEKKGIIQTYKIEYKKFWNVIKSIMSYERMGFGPKVMAKLDKLVNDNLEEFSCFIKLLLDFYYDEYLLDIFTNRLVELLYLRKHPNIIQFGDKIPSLNELKEIDASPEQTHLTGYGKIKELNKILDIMTDAYTDLNPSFYKAYNLIFIEGYEFYSHFRPKVKKV
ncbi:hypothetical protein KKF81_01005 [Candidatus Micrarchaeota archaeon]|nr:hypothetical protein [Candidatus Micrarchaeota archaeon]MBU1165498.1 hypothetical protein [Candidatus Micrarchaeota archaeon]MBU1886336.1 hypothetical protein [Candidatus Micrarchaeota archaeon]